MNRSPYSDGQNLFCLLAALLSTLSVQGLFFILPDSGTPGMGAMYQLNALLDGFGHAYSQNWLSWCCLMAFFFFAGRRLYFAEPKLRLRPFAVFLAAAFTLFFFIGACMEKYGAFEPVLSGKFQLVLLGVSAAGCFIPLLAFFGRLPAMLPVLFSLRFAPKARKIGKLPKSYK